ncbi:glutathione s-transferase [Moniliophthora roreri MCA 2997]|uniref:Glutathione s-transferase n=2 Tax=Moniliophthora roreri TaxID=221103 RepID=V2WLW1_MONRO|nr:glutathione s-transferase [Moniliophthora roreri MCA 2997]KAI3616715.1 glutathione s-transferase [Moniliophthora roreri]
MITLHYLNDSRGQRILWLLEELCIPYTLKRYTRDAILRRAPNDLRVNSTPLNKSPSIEDTGEDGTENLVLGESGAIVEYLITRYGKNTELYMAPESPGWTDNLFYTHLAEGSLQPLLFVPLLKNVYKLGDSTSDGKDIPAIQRNYLNPNLIKFGKMITEHLRRLQPGQYLAGREVPTAADFMMFYTLEAFVARAPREAVSEEIREYVERARQRTAYQRALEKGGPFNMIC